MRREPCKTHFSPGQVKLQVSPPLVSAPSDSPFISPQSDLSKSADLIMPCSTYKALTFPCSSRIKAHLPSPAGDTPPQPSHPMRPCCSPPGPPHPCAGTLNLGPPFTQAPLSPTSGPVPTVCYAHPPLFDGSSVLSPEPSLSPRPSSLPPLSKAVVTPTTPSFDFFTGWLLTLLLSVRVF